MDSACSESWLAQKYKRVNSFLLGQRAEPAHQVQASIRAAAQEGRDLFCQQWKVGNERKVEVPPPFFGSSELLAWFICNVKPCPQPSFSGSSLPLCSSHSFPQIYLCASRCWLHSQAVFSKGGKKGNRLNFTASAVRGILSFPRAHC